jgi:MATE family multidrug resistance protein
MRLSQFLEQLTQEWLARWDWLLQLALLELALLSFQLFIGCLVSLGWVQQGLTAQAIGSNNHSETSALLVRGIIIGLVAGLILILIQIPLFSGALGLAPASQEVEGLANEYLKIRVFSAPAAIAIFGITGWLIAKERTKAVLFLMLLVNSVNITLDFIFVLKLGWGVEGVAFATFIAEWLGLFYGLWLAREGFNNGYWKNWAQIFDRVRLVQMARVNSDILIRSVLLEIGFVSFLFLGSSFDDATLAANQVLVQFLNITAYAMDGFAFAAEALVGQALGAKNRAVISKVSGYDKSVGSWLSCSYGDCFLCFWKYYY